MLAWGLGWAVGISPSSQIHLAWPSFGWAIIETLPLLLFSWWCLHSRWTPLARLVGTVQESVVPMFASSHIAALALVSVLAGIGEEALFRGVLQGLFTEWLGVWSALAVTSVLFGLAHFVTSGYAILAGLIGVYLGALTLAHHNLLVPMVVHALYDFVALTYLVSRGQRGALVSPTAAANSVRAPFDDSHP